MQLNTNAVLMDDVAGRILEYATLREYYDMVCRELNCSIDDISILDVSEDAEDDEGWTIDDFFPKGTNISALKVLHENYSTIDFSIGRVVKFIVNGFVFIAEQNASPCIVYVNSKDLTILNVKSDN